MLSLAQRDSDPGPHYRPIAACTPGRSPATSRGSAPTFTQPRMLSKAMGTPARSTITTKGTHMSTIEESVQVQAPISMVYNQWTQFEEFPNFMEGIDEVRQLDATHLHWVATIGGTQHAWDAEVTEQIPDERVAWRNTDGKDNAGVVTFHKIADDMTASCCNWTTCRGNQGEGRRRARRGRPPGQGRPQALQGDDRIARRRKRAWRGEVAR